MNNKEKDDTYNPNNKKLNLPKFNIHGSERRKIKKELSYLKSFTKSFWSHHQLEKDMYSLFDQKHNISDDKAQEKYDSSLEEIEKLEKQLSVPYLPIYREERLNKLLNK